MFADENSQKPAKIYIPVRRTTLKIRNILSERLEKGILLHIPDF